MKRTIISLMGILVVLAVAGPSLAAITGASVNPSAAGHILLLGSDFVVVDKRFDPELFDQKQFPPPSPLGPITLNVTVDAAGDYWIEEHPYGGQNGCIYNRSGQSWTGFHFLLTTASDISFAPFSASTDAFSTVVMTSNTIDVSDGLVADRGSFGAVFAVHANEAGTFSIRETAIVPEPATLSLLGLGLAGLIARRRAQRA